MSQDLGGIDTTLDAATDEVPDQVAIASKKKLGWVGDVGAMRSGGLVDNPQRRDQLGILVAEDRKREMIVLDDSLRVLWLIHRNRKKMTAAAFNFLGDFSETSEFCQANRSPVAPIENQEHRALPGIVRQGD